MASPCWKCRTPIVAVMLVYDVAPTNACPICMDDEDPQVCVSAPCGHHICGSCARNWAARQEIYIPVPAAPAPGPAAATFRSAAAAFLDGEGSGVTPPPWHVAPPLDGEGSGVTPPPWHVAPPLIPAIGEVFQFQGRPVLWAQLWRFGTKIVLVWADTGLLCQGGDHVVRPTGIAGWLVKWHPAGERANRKWFLQAEVHDV